MLKLIYRKLALGNQKGDTIIEVLLAIAIAAFSIGTSYAIANRSLQKAVSARERNEAVNLLENQIAALKVRYKTNSTDFKSNDPNKGFVVSSTAAPSSFPYNDFHFCLDEQSNGPADTAHPWARQLNNFTAGPDNSQANTLSVGNPGYNANCRRATSTTDFYINISAQITESSKDTEEGRTVYKLMARWPQVGSSQVNSSTIYYRL